MERHEVLNLHLGSTIYVLDNECGQLQKRYVIQLVYLGEEIRVMSALTMEDRENCSVDQYKDVFFSREKAFDGFRSKLANDKKALQRKINDLDKKADSLCLII